MSNDGGRVVRFSVDVQRVVVGLPVWTTEYLPVVKLSVTTRGRLLEAWLPLTVG